MNAPFTCIQLDENDIKRALKAAIDRYPRLLALRFTLRLPDGSSTQPLDALITWFHAVLRQCINVSIDSRQSAGKPAPLTQISLLWGAVADTGLPDEAVPMLLLLNQDTFYSVRHDAALQEQIDIVNALINQAWSSVVDPSNELERLPTAEPFGCIQVARGDVEQYPSQYAALSNSVKSLASVVRTIR